MANIIKRKLSKEEANKIGWVTPIDFFELIRDEFGKFDLDVCADKSNTKAPRWIESDSLDKEWRGLCWMNPPPYDSKNITPWIKKAYETGQIDGNIVICLLPVSTDQRWFHDYCLRAREIRFVSGRLRFEGMPYGASFPSMIVIFQKGKGLKVKTMARRKSECK